MSGNKQTNKHAILGYGLFALFVVVLIVIRLFFGAFIAVSGPSMMPTFQDGEYVFSIKANDNMEYQKGDIVVFQHADTLLIKRIYGLPGTTTEADPSRGIPSVTLSDNQYYVVGDNYENSLDSRSFGPIEGSAIKFKSTDFHVGYLGFIMLLTIPTAIMMFLGTFIATRGVKKEPEEEVVPEFYQPSNLGNFADVTDLYNRIDN